MTAGLQRLLLGALSREWSGAAVAVAIGVAGVAVGGAAGVAIGVVAALLLAGALRHLAVVVAVLRQHPAPGRLVDIGGHAVHVLAEGTPAHGRPAVVWFGGGHASGASMAHLHRALLDATRSILIDRPGTGWSDAGPFPRRTGIEAGECWRALDAAGERGPFVLVGHSFGGLLAANMARRRRSAVAGVVLLDATPPDTIIYGPRLGALRAMRRGSWTAGLLRLFGVHDSPFERAQRREAPAVFALHERVVGTPAVADKALGVRAAPWFATASIFAELSPVGMAANAWDSATYDGDLDGMPVLLVAPGDAPEVAALPDVQAAADTDARRMVGVIARTRERYLAVSDRSRRVVTPPGTAHIFPLQVPEFVADTVLRFVDECAARAGVSDDVYDAVVVGLGAVGSAACHHLARRGLRVAGIDRWQPPHDHGSSHGLSRITRLALGEGEAFVPLAQRSHALWRELEAASGETLYRPTGGLLISSPAADARPYHGQSSFFARTVELARRHGIAHETLAADEIRRRWPVFRVRDDEHAYWERDAGVLYPERIVAAQLAQAARHGAVLRYGERVLQVEPAPHGGAVDVVTDRGRIAAARVVVAAGPWLARWPGAVEAGRLRVHRQVLHWFAADDLAPYAPDRCPVWIWHHGAGTDGSMYGFPTGDGVAGVKVATEQYADDADPDAVDRGVSAAEADAMFRGHVDGRLAGLRRAVVRSATCLYTCTTDASFVVRGSGAGDGVTVVSACSGHGFKHSAAMGEAIAQRLAGERAALIESWLAG